jgi:DNA-directed RNA polymerase II subunit RPB1
VGQVANTIQLYFGDALECLYDDDNATNPAIRLRLQEDNDDPPTVLTNIQELLLDNVVLKGIHGIQRVFLRQEKLEWMLDTEGTNLLDVMGVPGVDGSRTTSNNIIEVLETLGIEAARSTLLRELKQVLSFDGSYVNHRQLAILVDVMTYRGHLMSITRHGVNRTEIGPLTRCSFEETADILLEAATFAESDNMKGVTDNILIGQLAPLGTGHFDLYLDAEKLQTLSERQLSSQQYSSSASPSLSSRALKEAYEQQQHTATLQYFDEIDYAPPSHRHLPPITILPSIRPTIPPYPRYDQPISYRYSAEPIQGGITLFNYEPKSKPQFLPTL